ncbi:hypothetical protein RKE25_09855 [Dyella sp. BiH032]|uniref:SDH family Clp fold serine proteinase n=1 Tax=Dyella sp. BiH032 TaxID=3075430 RepID=UPI0028936A3C|nr:hypothetical protein [Dyella sp. BiH032]WNL47903.1 hypothetical protein RKE25_09855 [Dyella sp. BiH032]
MGLQQRVALYRELEQHRGKPLVIYVTSTRENSAGQISSDAIPELLTQLHALPPDTQDIDLLVVSNGGDPTVAWRIVSLIREQVKHFSILVPQAAFSAATLLALGADKIVMHPHGNLGPTDPQITNRKKAIQFGSEDVRAFLRFAREEVGLTDQKPLRDLFLRFSEEVGFVGIGVAARSAQLSQAMAEGMLGLHMKEDGKQSARAISELLNKNYFHHGYPLNRKEAKQIGLKIEPSDETTERLMWSIWKDIEQDLKLKEPFLPIHQLKSDPACSALFSPVPQVSYPPGIGQQQLQVLMMAFAQQIAAERVPPTNYEVVVGLMESPRHASLARVKGSIFGARQPDLEFKVQIVPEVNGWIDVPIPPAQQVQ